MIRDGALHLAPIASEGYKVKRILDVGTGTGIWAIDMADKHKDAEIVGVDLSPIQPSWVPPNLRFEIDDVENDWTFTRNFDFIHIRGLAGSILDWPKLLRQAYRFLKPGGYIEISENDFRLDTDDGEVNPLENPVHAFSSTSPSEPGPSNSQHPPPPPRKSRHRIVAEGTFCRKYTDTLAEAAHVAGRDLSIVLRMKDLLENVGFTNIKRTTRKLPWGAWPKDKKFRELGAWVMLLLESGLEAYAMQLLTTITHMTPKEVMDLVEGVKKELRERKVHVYAREHILYAQKPFRNPNSSGNGGRNPDRQDTPNLLTEQESTDSDEVDDDEKLEPDEDENNVKELKNVLGRDTNGDVASIFSERSRWSS